MKTYTKIGYDLVVKLIPENSRVLDLGCGSGDLLVMLQKIKKVKGAGVEISEEGVSKCVEKGLYCYQGDIDEGLMDYRDNSFDYVILNQTIQSTKRPRYVLKEIMRIGKKSIISFPNFAYIYARYQLLFQGKIPKNILFPFEWYESPNIHQLSIKDFEEFCAENNYTILKKFHFNIHGSSDSKVVKIFPNLFAQYGFFLLNGEKPPAKGGISSQPV